MVNVEHPLILEREIPFIADEISFVNVVMSEYSNPIAPNPEVYAATEFDKATRESIDKMRV
jgi:hypothetical protein